MRRMRTFPAIPQSVHAARRFATDTLSSSSAATLEAVELMVSELATNCIRHERTSFHVTILGSTREIRVEVTDSGSGRPRMRSPGPDEPSGRGLQIVDMLSDSWGVEAERPSGKTVWFTMPAATDMDAIADQIGSRRRIGEESAPTAGDPSSVQRAERAPNGPTSLRRRARSQYRLPAGTGGGDFWSQGRVDHRRYCQNDESGSPARPPEHLGRLR